MARLQRVFIDTSELFPFTIMDVLLTLSEDLLFTWVWTDELLTEWEEVIVREGQRTSKSAASVVAAPAAVVCAAESPDESSLQAANRTSAAMGRARRRDDIR